MRLSTTLQVHKEEDKDSESEHEFYSNLTSLTLFSKQRL